MSGSRSLRFLVRGMALALAVFCWGPVWAADPLRIGFTVSLTGATAVNGKQVLLAIQIWRDDINAR
ncbi:MAG: hypothetical protein JO157_04745, partial [Acetobacteraceae bacterium]|nr:hypothetical protein [Acetobacteraceae bacterium]